MGTEWPVSVFPVGMQEPLRPPNHCQITAQGGSAMREDRRDVALAIKSCLDSLQDDAIRCALDDLARFIGLAALAAEEAAVAHDPRSAQIKALMTGDAGHC